jgi:hypothetical protein
MRVAPRREFERAHASRRPDRANFEIWVIFRKIKIPKRNLRTFLIVLPTMNRKMVKIYLESELPGFSRNNLPNGENTPKCY